MNPVLVPCKTYDQVTPIFLLGWNLKYRYNTQMQCTNEEVTLHSWAGKDTRVRLRWWDRDSCMLLSYCSLIRKFLRLPSPLMQTLSLSTPSTASKHRPVAPSHGLDEMETLWGSDGTIKHQADGAYCLWSSKAGRQLSMVTLARRLEILSLATPFPGCSFGKLPVSMSLSFLISKRELVLELYHMRFKWDKTGQCLLYCKCLNAS